MNISYCCGALFRFNRDQGILFITPKVKDITHEDKKGQGNKILSPLLEAMSDIEYPVDLKDLSPITTKLLDENLNIHVSVTKIQTSDNTLIIFIKPIPKIEKKKMPVKK